MADKKLKSTKRNRKIREHKIFDVNIFWRNIVEGCALVTPRQFLLDLRNVLQMDSEIELDLSKIDQILSKIEAWAAPKAYQDVLVVSLVAS